MNKEKLWEFKSILSIFLHLAWRQRVFVVQTLCKYLLENMEGYLSNVVFLRAFLSLIVLPDTSLQCLFLLLGLSLFFAFSEWYSVYYQCKIQPIAIELWGATNFEKISANLHHTEILNYDNPGYLNALQYVLTHFSEDTINILSSLAFILSNTFQVIISIVLFQGTGLLLFGTIAIAIVGEMVIGKKTISLLARREKEISSLERKEKYSTEILFNRDALKERKVSLIDRTLRKVYDASVSSHLQLIKQYGKRIFKCDLIKEVVCDHILLSFAVISVLIIKVSNGNISMVSFVPLVNSVAIIAGCMIEATDHVRLLNKAFFSLKQYLVINQTSNTNRQYAIAEQVYDQTIKAIEVKNVHFSYPHSCSEAIKEVNMTLHTGKIYALVGINGSGKTTLCHLLSGLYTPARGEIKIMTEKGLFDPLIENTPTSSFITQNMHSIEASYAENIAFNISFKKEAMEEVIAASPVHKMATLPIDQWIGYRMSIPDSVILSGGEEQELMCLHVLYQNYPIIILDEPAAMMDPEKEIELNNRIASLSSNNNIIILVSHRPSTILNADYIYVINQGVIAEHGTHKQLISQPGIYSEMWEVVQRDIS